MTDHPFPFALLAVHMVGGYLSLLSGAAAMANPKGSRRHGGWGTLFFVSMMTLTVTGVFMATVYRPVMGNFMGSSLGLYMTLTAWLTMWRKPGEVGRIEVAAMAWGVIVVASGLTFGRLALDNPRGTFDDYPAMFYFIIGGIVLLAVAFDVRMIARGGLTGTARLTRHLGRMCGAMFLVNTSFFLGRARDFPEVIRQSGVLRIPTLIVLALAAYWVFRVRILPPMRRWWARRKGRHLVVGAGEAHLEGFGLHHNPLEHAPASAGSRFFRTRVHSLDGAGGGG